MTRNYQTGYDCERCTSSEMVHGASTLADVYQARLCTRCCNDWAAFIKDNEIFQDREHAEDRRAMFFAMSQGDGRDRIQDITQLRKTTDVLNAKLIDIARRWVKLSEPSDSEPSS